MKKILQRDHIVLRQVAREIPVEDIPTARIQKIIAEMKESLASQEDGVAIAAPQLGYPMRMFVVSGKVPHIVRRGDEPYNENIDGPKYEDSVYINPVITKISSEKKLVEEGCLSVRYLYGKVKRSTKATVRAYNEHGALFTKGASGLLAQIFQHETDHLDGILFIDKAKDLEEIIPDHVKHAANK